MSSDLEMSPLERLLTQGVVVSHIDGNLHLSAPLNSDIACVFESADIDDTELVDELSRKIALDGTAKPIIAAGPLTSGQERQVRSRNLLSDAPLLVKPAVFQIDGPLNVEALENAVDYTVVRFPALRACIRLRADNIFVQAIKVPRLGYLQKFDLSSQAELAAELEKMLNEQLGPLNDFFLARLFRMSDTLHFLAISMHHMVSDVFSVGLFYQSLSWAYLQTNPPLPEPKDAVSRYFEIIRTSQENRRSDQGQKSLEYWSKTFEPPFLPIEWNYAKPLTEVFSKKTCNHIFLLDQIAVAAANRRSESSGITCAQQMFAAWALTLRLFCESDEIRIAVMAACRTSPSLEKEIGLFANPMVVQIDFGGIDDISSILDQITSRLSQALVHQETPMQDIIQHLSAAEDFDIPRFYQTMFAFNNVPTTELSLGDTVCREFSTTLSGADNNLSAIDLRISLTPVAEGLQAVIAYKPDLFDSSHIQKMEDVFRRCLKLIALGANTEWKMII